ncbi:MAG: hypothetical protein Q7T63_07050 [Burkholderiaceae bacterium]|uniref:hypothetical protein n=1 Tax=Hydrogenophaga sp. TaxID=1904254 RepID=UPI002717CB09|nr:hypothetical protein [Hydrogenophaga sp.]MDO8277866.1 hypothetical protein [Burkholderiaceae bacterium]MDO9030936.1 hypothetical protein [Hydrogenophaga sp.]
MNPTDIHSPNHPGREASAPGQVHSGRLMRRVRSLALATLDIDTLDAFDQWCVHDLSGAIPFDIAICIAARLHEGRVHASSVHTINFPMRRDSAARRQFQSAGRRYMGDWLRLRRPQILAIDRRLRSRSDDTAHFPTLGLRGMAIHGVTSASGRQASCFVFGQFEAAQPANLALRLELLIPHIHQAFVSVRGVAKSAGCGVRCMP